MTFKLTNKTAAEKRNNSRFEEYLKYTHTNYHAKTNNDILTIDIETSEDEINRVKHALDLLVICPQGRQVAYGY